MKSSSSHPSSISRIPWPLRSLGVPLYWLGYQGHRQIYRWGLKQTTRLPVPVICVGNLTVGGSGKTPVVIALARLLADMGRRVGVLSRGYLRQNSSRKAVAVSVGQRLLASVEEVGDEALLIAQEAPQAVVIVCPNRSTGGWLAIEKHQCDVLLLDDGCEHWALERDIDLVCVDSTLLLENARLLPLGPYREPVSALRRASAILLTQKDDPAAIKAQKDYLRRQEYAKDLPIWPSHTKPTGLIDFNDGSASTPASLAGKLVIGACGLAQPAYFRDTLKESGAEIIEFFALSDHDSFADATIQRIEQSTRQHQTELIVVTAKDFVKLKGRVAAALPWGYLNVQVDWSEEQTATIRSFLQSALERAHTSANS